MAVALLGILVSGLFGRELERRLAPLSIDPTIKAELLAERGKLAAIEPPAGLGDADSRAVRTAVLESFHSGFRATARVSALLALVAAACSAIWIPGRTEA
jgi:hypothetical protein